MSLHTLMNKARYLIPLTFLLVSVKWFFLWRLNIGLDFTTVVINNIKDWQYFTLIYNLSELNFTPVYDKGVSNSLYLPFPIYSLIFHSLFFKILNIYGFILVEYIAILIFFIILNKICEELKLNFNQSTFLSIIIYCFPSLIQFLNFSGITYINVIKELYHLRIPRPLITHLYLFFFIYLIIKVKKIEQFKLKNLSLIGLLLAIMWGSFYYNFIICSLIFIFYYLLIFFKKKYFKLTIKHATLISLSFFIFSSPIIFFVILNGEPDYMTRVGLINLNIEAKEILLKHFFNKIISIKFILVFFIISCCYFYLKKKNFYDQYKIDLLYITFISSFLSPVIFIILSPKISEIYHFSNMIVGLSFFILLIYTFLILNIHIDKNLIQKFILIFCSFVLVGVNFFSIFNDFKINSYKILTRDMSDVYKFLNQNSFNKNDTILTIDGKIQTRLILDGYRNFLYIDGIFTSLKDEIIENKLIDSFKFLQLDVNDFAKFIENKKEGWRYINNYIGKTFNMKYQANNLFTYKSSSDFTLDEMLYISKSSPLHTQQLIIPKFEINRLINNFINREINSSIEPMIIIMNNNDFFSKKIKINYNLYCQKVINKTYKVFYKKTQLNKNCSKY